MTTEVKRAARRPGPFERKRFPKTGIIQNLSRQGALLEARCAALEAGTFAIRPTSKNCGALTLAVQRVSQMKKERAARMKLPQTAYCRWRRWIDLDAAEVNSNAAWLACESRSRCRPMAGRCLKPDGGCGLAVALAVLGRSRHQLAT